MMHGSYNDHGDRRAETFLISLETGRRRNLGTDPILLDAVASAFNDDVPDLITPLNNSESRDTMNGLRR